MDVATFRMLQDSEWVRMQRDRIALGEVATCPVADCGGQLEPYDAEIAIAHGSGVPHPGGVRCGSCGARSRAVAL